MAQSGFSALSERTRSEIILDRAAFLNRKVFLNGFLINAEFTYLDLEDRPMCTR